MCGLVGYFSKNLNYSEDKLKYLLLSNEIRGKDSSGLFIKNDEDNYIVKSVGTVSENLLPNIKFPKDCSLAIGHTRAKTQGAPTKANAHPFQYGSIVGAHNGRITNAWTLCTDNGLRSVDYDVDSMVVYALMNKFKEEGYEDYIKRTILLLKGPQALLFTDLEFPNRLYFFRRSQQYAIDERPLFKGTIKVDDNEGYYISSLKDSLKAINCHNIQEVEEDCLHYIDHDGKMYSEHLIFPVEKSFSTNTTVHNQQTHNVKQRVIGFRSNLREDAIDWRDVLQTEYALSILKENNEKDKDDNQYGSAKSCHICFGLGSVGSSNENCTECNGSGWIYPSYKKVESSKSSFTVNDFSKGDIVLIVAGEKKGFLAEYQSNSLQDNRKSILSVFTQNSIPNYYFNVDFIKYKDKSGVIICSLDKLQERYKIETIINYNHYTQKNHKKTVIEETTINNGDIIFYEDANSGDKLMAEVLNYNKTYNLMQIQDLSNLFYGRKREIVYNQYSIELIMKNNERVNDTIVDICDILTSYYPKEKTIDFVTSHILNQDDVIQNNIDDLNNKQVKTEENEKILQSLYEIKYANYTLLTTLFNEQIEEVKQLKEQQV